MDATEEIYYCFEKECKAPYKMMTTITDFRNGLHNGHEIREISKLRAELADLELLWNVENDSKDELM